MDLFAPLDAPQTLWRVGRLYLSTSNVRTFVPLALFFVVPATAVLLAIVYQTIHPDDGGDADGDEGRVRYFFHNLNGFLVVLGSQTLLKATLGAVAEAAICVAVLELYLQRRPQWCPCLRRGASRVTALLLANVVASAVSFVGYLFLYLPGLFVCISLSVVTPVVVVEQDLDALAALARSFQLTTGHRLYVLSCLAALGLLYWLLSAAVHALTGAAFLSPTFHLLRVLPASVFYPALCTLKTVVYVNLRVVKEGLTAEQLSREVGQPLDEVGTDYRRVPLVLDQESAVDAEASGTPEMTMV